MTKPWFGRKKLGWGWGLPQRYEGWVVLILYVVFLWLFQFLPDTRMIFLPLTLLTSIVLFIIAWITSGKPQWGTWWYKKNKSLENKMIKVVLLLVGLSIVIFGIKQTILLTKAHSTFDNYYAFRGCVQLLQKTSNYGFCRTTSGQTIKIVKFQKKWYLDKDLPNCLFKFCF